MESSGQQNNSPEYAYGGTWFQLYETMVIHVHVAVQEHHVIIYDINVYRKR